MNSKRKLMLAITALTMSMTSAMAVSACGNKHKHSYSDDDWTVVTEPTCTEAGLESHKCQGCDETETRPIDAIGHAFSDDGWVLTTDPTCIADGEETRECANDSSHVEHRPVGKTDHHTVTEWVNTDPTYHWKKCTTKGCTEISEKTVHVWNPDLDEVLQAPEENTDGSKRRHCECGATKISPIPMLSHVEHTYEDTWQKNATKHYKECTYDGCEEVLESIHDWNITTPATCDTAGSKVCKVCDYETEIPALGHTWTANKVVKTPATCETAGEEGYKCTICGEFKDVTAIPALGHKYDGDWIIDNPDANTKGSAVKYCANDKDHDHDIDLELPELNNTDYVVDEGESVTTYTLKKDETIVITIHKNLNVEKAIDVAVSNMGKVMSGEIVNTSKMGMDNKAPTDTKLKYEKGNNYIHITDEGMLTADYGGVEMFITKNADGTYFFPYKTIASGTGYVDMDDRDHMTVANKIKDIYDGGGDPVANGFEVAELVGSIFPIIRDGNEVSKFPAEQLSVGAPFTLLYADHSALSDKQFYGIENLIKALYTVAKTNPNNDVVENKSEPDEKGITTYTFSFGYKGSEEGFFAVYSVEFKLDKNFVMVGATVENKGYTNRDWNEAKQDYDALNNYSYQDGKYVVNAGAKSLWSETYSVSQTRFENGAKPVNPYSPEDMKVSRFDITQIEEHVIYATEEYTISGVQTVNDNVGNSIDAVAGDDGSIMLRFVNVYPVSANFFMDEVKLELYTADGKLIEELDSQYTGGNDGHVKARYNATDNILALSFWLAGDYKLKISTTNVEKVINLHIPFIAPTGFAADVYQYNDVLEMWSNTITKYEVYEGQALALSSIVDHPAYQTSDFTVTVKNAADETVEGLVSAAQYVEGIEGKEVRLFRAESAGVYTVTIKSAHAGSNVTASFTVTVKEAPDVDAMLDGEFFNEDEEVTVEFKTVETVKQAVITMGEENPTTVSYTYNEETHEFNVTHVSGPDDKNFGFELSEAFNLYLTYEQEVSGIRTKVLISNSINDTLSGEYTTPEEGRLTLMASASGVYRITVVSAEEYSWGSNNFVPSDDYSYLYYNTGAAGEYGQPADNVEIGLVKGGSVEIYSFQPDYNIYTFKIEYVGKLTPVTGVTLEDAEVGEGQEVTLTPEFTPENASVQTGKWTSSNEDVATVENGVVTGVSAGTATIQFVSDDGAFKATCTVTVTEFVLKPGSDITFPVGGYGSSTNLKFKGEANTEYALIDDTGYACTFYALDSEGNSGDPITKITTDDDGFAYFQLYFAGYGNPWISIVKPVAVSGITIDKDALESNEWTVGDSLNLSEYVTIEPEDAIDKSFTITSDDESVAVGDDYGTLKAVGAGETTITVTTNDGGFSETFTITVLANEISVGVPKELGVNDFGECESIVSLAGGKANTTYLFKVVNSVDSFLSSVSNGQADYASYSSNGMLELTTDKNGNVSIYVSAGGSVTLTVEESAPVEVGEFEIMVGVDKEIASLTTEAATYTLVGCEDGEDYVLSIYDTEGNLRTDVSVQCTDLGIYGDGDPTGEIEFTYQDGAAFEISAKEGTVSDVVIKLEQVIVTPVYPTVTLGGEAVELTVGTDGVTFMLEDCEADKTYKLTAVNGSDETSTEVLFYMEPLRGNPVEFTYGMLTRMVSIGLVEGVEGPVTVYVKVEEAEDDSTEEMTVGEEVTVSGLDGMNYVATYKINLTAGTYNIYVDGEKLNTINAGTDVCILDGPSYDANVIETDDGNVEIEISGSYYVFCYANATIKIEKIADGDEEDNGAVQITTGTKDLGDASCLNSFLELVGVESGATYTFTFTNENPDASEICLAEADANGMWVYHGMDPNTSSGSGTDTLTISVTAESDSSIYVTIEGLNVTNATLTVVKA